MKELRIITQAFDTSECADYAVFVIDEMMAKKIITARRKLLELKTTEDFDALSSLRFNLPDAAFFFEADALGDEGCTAPVVADGEKKDLLTPEQRKELNNDRMTIVGEDFVFVDDHSLSASVDIFRPTDSCFLVIEEESFYYISTWDGAEMSSEIVNYNILQRLL